MKNWYNMVHTEDFKSCLAVLGHDTNYGEDERLYKKLFDITCSFD